MAKSIDFLDNINYKTGNELFNDVQNDLFQFNTSRFPDIVHMFTTPPNTVKILSGGGSNGYLGSSEQSLTPMLLISRPRDIDPVNSNTNHKFGVAVNRVCTSDDITVDGMTFDNNGITSQASTNYCEFSKIKLNGAYGDYNELISILQGGVYI